MTTESLPSVVPRSGTKEGVKKFQIFLLNIPRFYGQLEASMKNEPIAAQPELRPGGKIDQTVRFRPAEIPAICLTQLRIKNLEKIRGAGFFELSHAFCTTHARFEK